MEVFLGHPRDVEELKRQIREAANAKQRDRLRAVELAVAGETTPSIMRMLGRSRGFVQRWIYTYRDHGLDAVAATSPPGRAARLPEDQHEGFRQRVLAGPTEDDGVCTLRGRDFVRILDEEFGVQYSLSGVYELLHRLGLSVLAPRPQHRDADPEVQQRWVESAPLLSAGSAKRTPRSAWKSGSRTKRVSASKAR